jgi:catechol 2,3-dioxygenase-like lactoylglutathione lyase family enzyme
MKTNYPKMHVSLYVKNIADTVEFYTSFFGTEVTKVEPKYAKFILDDPALIISFIENENKVKANFGHLGFQVDRIEELKSRLEKAKEKNLVELEEMGTSCCYALQDKFWVKDPDGYAWEVYYFHEDVKFNDPHYTLDEKENCCTPAQSEKTEASSCC